MNLRREMSCLGRTIPGIAAQIILDFTDIDAYGAVSVNNIMGKVIARLTQSTIDHSRNGLEILIILSFGF
jgi:hypothetical protein